ncbi:MAG: 16S rRNA (guanine(966)-N(2))-methyltransferase RsmD [Methylococcales bacterium]|nr:16S rRNA (guanine(966)-N(2))-methyltransferase RsmD [Methylococcales bacterium]
MQSKLRIIAGEWRSRQLIFEDTPGLRPTPARVRETVFNWLQKDVASSQCLDLYAGSGALGFEAASRGAKSVLMVENHPQACRLIKQNTDKLATDKIKIIQGDVFKFLAGDASAFDLIFLDPPFGKGLAQQTCHWLEDKNWLTSQAKIYVEVESDLNLDDMPVNWQLLKSKKSGEVGYYLFERKDSE